jgi:hypothetical protein
MGKRKRTKPEKDFGSPTGFRDKRGAAKDVSVRAYARRSTNLTVAENTRMLARYALLKDGPNGKKEGVADLAAEFGVDERHITQGIVPRALDEQRSNPMAHFVDNREPAIFTEDVDAFMVDQSVKWDGQFTWQELADAVNEEYELPEGVPTETGTRKHCKKVGWTDTKQQTLPWLTDAHFKARETWAKRNGRKKQNWKAWVDVDEKWFYTVKLGLKRKKGPGQKVPPRFARSKTQIPKVMFLAASARPRPGFDGKVGIWRVAEKHTAARRSKNHEKDDEYDKDATMTTERYFAMMQDSVFPAIVSAFAGTKIKTVVVQQDGASPHTGKDVVARLNAIGAKLSPKLKVRTQPAQSPDMNINDLAFFRALDVLVRKVRRGESNAFDKEKLVADVLKAHAEYPSEQLEAMWDYKSYVMEAVEACGGGNDYSRHRPKEA